MAQEIADSTLLDTWGSGGNIVEPDISKIIEGWQLGEQPPHEYMNWLQNTFGSKLNHILKNGVASWNNGTEYLAGSSVQHNGNIWLCKAINTNSEPADVNANWKRIITVESLTTILNGYVKNTGDETIDGIKTFSSRPIVPTPTAGTHAVNKTYVDSKANINAFPEKITPVDTDNLAIQETGGLLKKVSFTSLMNWVKSFSFGWGQTWQVMTASRSANVVYTNNTDKPIMVAIVHISGVNTPDSVRVSNNGTDWISVGGNNSGVDYMSNQFIVPSGWQYKSIAFSRWAELR